MLRLVSTSSMPMPVPVPGPGAFPEAFSGDGLLDQLGPVAEAHVLVLGGGAELVGGLIRRGCLAATALRRGEKPEAAAHDVVLAPHVAATDDLDALVHLARRALVPTGEFVARLTGAPDGRVLGLARRLRLNGFLGIRTAPLAGVAVMRAILPAFDLAART